MRQHATSGAAWWLYIVECADGTLYTGVTTDVSRRIAEHNGSTRGAKYTRSRRPVELRYTQPCADRSDAQRQEARIKRLSRTDKLRLVCSK